MESAKLIFLKALRPITKSTQESALSILNNPKYDKYPQYVDKNAIQKAFDDYGSNSNPFTGAIYSKGMNAPNIEGEFLSANLPEIHTKVYHAPANVQMVRDVLSNDNEVTHIGLSTYANDLKNGIDIIKMIYKEFPETKLFVGNMGSLYPQIQQLVKKDMLCRSNGVNWLRTKMDLLPLSRFQFSFPFISSEDFTIDNRIKTVYTLFQIGCPFGCDFCVTTQLLNYSPISRKKQIVKALDKLLSQTSRDIILYVCDPNAFYPVKIWKEIFEYFINHYNEYDSFIHLIVLSSLPHVSRFDLETIQQKSPIKLFMINFGMESTLEGGYRKNIGINNNIIKRMSKLGIITYHNFILGLPRHNHSNIFTEIERNLQYDSTFFNICTLKTIPSTPIYEQLKSENKLFGPDLPLELIYQEGFLAFTHDYLGRGFDILKYTFHAYQAAEDKILDAYSSMTDTFSNSNFFNKSEGLVNIAKQFTALSELNFQTFSPRKPSYLVDQYQKRLIRLREKIKL